MNRSWPLVPLGEILRPVSRPEAVDPEKTYKILGAHWYAKGLYIKDTLPGSEIRADKVYRVEERDFVYNRLFAWKGSFAVAVKENATCYVSNEFPCFLVNQDRADPIYLWKYFSRSSAWDEALNLSTGGTPTSRNRLKEEKFLGLKIPLAPPPEQRRIVARIEELAAKINEARGLRQKAMEEAEHIMAGVELRIWPKNSLINAMPLGRVTTFLARGKQSEQGESEHFLIKTQHVQQGRYIPTRMRLASHSAAKVLQEAIVQDEDILIACSAACASEHQRDRFRLSVCLSSRRSGATSTPE